MPAVQVTVHHPDDLWHALQVLAAQEGDAPTVSLRAVEESFATAAKNQDNQPGKCRDLVQTLSTPVADLHLSVRPAFALQNLNIQNVHELVQHTPTDLFAVPNFGNKSPTEGKEKLATLGLTLAMTLEEDSYRAAIVAAVAATIVAAKGGAA
jgi:DNA-directed RNA polymerase alpha subunit